MGKAKITGWGKYVPNKIVTNSDLEKMLDTNDEWITTRTETGTLNAMRPDDQAAGGLRSLM